MIKNKLTEKLSFLSGITAPIKAVVTPGKYFEWLKQVLDKYGIYGKSVIYFGSWLGMSMMTFIILLMILFLRNMISLNLTGFIMTPLTAFLYSFLFPIIVTIIDASIIAATIVFFPRERSLLDVYVIRASSLLPYALRVIILGLEGKLSIIALMVATISKFGLLMLIVGAILTMYGLRKTIGVSTTGAILGGITPIIYKLLLEFV